MSIVVPRDVSQLVENQLASGRYQSADEVLRSAMAALTEFDEDLVAVQQAVAEWRNGDAGVPLDEAIQQIREGGRQGVVQ